MVKPKAETQKDVKYTNAITLVAMAVLILAAIQPWNAWNAVDPNYYGWNLFSYFTVQSNLLAAIVYVIAAIAILRNQTPGGWFRFLRAGVVLYMLITGLVYTLLLQNNPDVHSVLGFDWKNFVLHQFGPLFILFWWLLWPSSKSVSAKQALWWLIFPILWLTYTFIRAAFIDWYPYPFLNPDKVGGYEGVSLYVIDITLGFIIISQIIAWVSRMRAKNISLY